MVIILYIQYISICPLLHITLHSTACHLSIYPFVHFSSISEILHFIQSYLYYYLIISTHSEVKILEKRRDAVIIDREESVTNYYKIRQQLAKLDSQMQVNFITMYMYIQFCGIEYTHVHVHVHRYIHVPPLREFWPTPLTSHF